MKVLARSLLFLCILSSFVGGDAFAELPLTKNLKSWIGNESEEKVFHLYQRHKIELVKSDSFTPKEIESFIKGAEALPRSFFRIMGKPIRMSRNPKPCLFGVGRANRDCPIFNKSGDFVIYNLPPIQGEGPVQRYEQLEDDERIDLQRRRAVVHAVMRKVENKEKWSKEKKWRSINGWRSKGSALNRDIWGYSRYLGAISAAFDLLTFSESYFVRFQDVTQKKLDPNRDVQCQEFAKVRFFDSKISSSDPKWYRSIPKSCPDFDQWANISQLESIDVLSAAATPDRPESLYGHLLVHLRYKGRSNGFEPVYQFGAVTDTDVSKITYFVKGFLGGFLSVLDVTSYRSTDKRVLQHEQRNLKRFQLNLSPQQRVQVLERIWEIERRHRYSYIFFFNNCASFLFDLFGGALNLDFPGRESLIITPSDVLDTMANTENGKRGKLLVKAPLIKLSPREIALQSVKERRILLQKAHLEELQEALESPEAKIRIEGYRTLKKSLFSKDYDFELGLDLIYSSVQIEMYFAQIAESSRRHLKVKQLTIPSVSAEKILARRREVFSETPNTSRYEDLFKEARKIEQDIREKRIKPNPKEKEILNWADDIQKAYENITELNGYYIDEKKPDFEGYLYLQKREENARILAEKHDQLSIGPSGKGRLVLGFENDNYTNKFRLRVEGAVIKEKLGEQRRRGFRSDIESIALAFKTSFPLSVDIFSDIDMDLTILSFLSATQKIGPIRRHFFDYFGWGFDTALQRIPRHGVEASLQISGGLLLPLFGSPKYDSFLIFGLYPEVRGTLSEGGKKGLAGAGGWARYQLHLFGRYPNIFEFHLSSKHFLELPNPTYRYEWEGRMGFQFLPFLYKERPALIRPFLSANYSNISYTPSKPYLLDFRTGIDFEVPF